MATYPFIISFFGALGGGFAVLAKYSASIHAASGLVLPSHRD